MLVSSCLLPCVNSLLCAACCAPCLPHSFLPAMSDRYAHAGGRGGGGGSSYRGRGRGRGGHSHASGNGKRPHNSLLSQTSSHAHQYTNSPPGDPSAPHSNSHAHNKRPRTDSSQHSAGRPLTVSDLLADTLTPLANSHWAPGQPFHLLFDAALIPTLYQQHIAPATASSTAASSSLQVLELSAYLENYLWRHFPLPPNPPASHEHLLSIVALVNEKFRSSLLQPFAALTGGVEGERKFGLLFKLLIELKHERDFSTHEATQFVLFFTHLFSSLEDAVVRRCALRLVSVLLWRGVGRSRRDDELRERGELRAVWRKVVRQCQSGKAAQATVDSPSLDSTAAFLPRLIREFVAILYSLQPLELATSLPSASYSANLLYCHRFLELCTDLLSQLPTRRFVRTLLSDCHLIELCRLSPIAAASTADPLFLRLLDSLSAYHTFEVDDHTGDVLPAASVQRLSHERLERLQRLVWRGKEDEFGGEEVKRMALVNVASLDNRDRLMQWLRLMNVEQLRRLCARLHLLDEAEEERKEEQEVEEEVLRKSMVTSANIISLVPPASYQDFLLSILCSYHLSHPPHHHQIDSLPLYPTEALLFDTSVLPASSTSYSGLTPLPLPKLNLQFLSLSDYLLRNFHLFRLEASYQIREDLAYAVGRLHPSLSGGETVFDGWSRMAAPLRRFAVVGVQPPLLGELVPREVTAEVEVDLKPFVGAVRSEWEEIREYDVLFLVTVRARLASGQAQWHRQQQQYEAGGGREDVMRDEQADDAFLGGGGVGEDDTRTDNWAHIAGADNPIVYVRGCEVRAVVDESGAVIGERDITGKQHHAVGSIRTYRLYLDPAQYAADMQRVQSDDTADDVYTTFNLLIRRKAKENNFKGVLSSIRDILQAKQRDVELPPFMRDVFLGYGDVESSCYWRLPDERRRMEFVDSFLDERHVVQSFDRPLRIIETDEQEGRTAEEEQDEADEVDRRQAMTAVDVSGSSSVVRASAAISRLLKRLCGSADAATAASTTQPSYRLTFPLHLKPNYAALQQLLSNVQYDPATDKSYQPLLSHPNLVNPEVPFRPSAAAVSVVVDEPPPAVPVLPPLLPPAPFAGVEPVFTRPHPVLHIPSPASPQPADNEEKAEPVSAAADSKDELSVLTVKQLKHKLKELGLPQSGVKAELVERLAQHGSERKHGTAEERKEKPAEKADREMKEEVGQQAREQYEKQMDEFHAAKAEYDRLLAVYQQEKAKHEQEERDYQQARQQQEEVMAAYKQRLLDYKRRTGQLTEQERELVQGGGGAVMQIDVQEAPSQNLPTPPVSARTRSHDMGVPERKQDDVATGEGNDNSSSAVSAPSGDTTPAIASSASSTPSPDSSSLSVILARRIPRVAAHSAHVRHNTVRFTPMQLEAIHSGVNPGLTLIVGPPGTGNKQSQHTMTALCQHIDVRFSRRLAHATIRSHAAVVCAACVGKTDTAVQIISELLHNYPTQRILLVTHSNHALNDLFEKCLTRNIDERYLLRLGHASDQLDVGGRDFSRFGRVQHMLGRRLMLLDVVKRLGESVGVGGDVGYTCETSAAFYVHQVLTRWEKYGKACRDAKEVYDRMREEGADSVTAEQERLYQATPAALFPFKSFFTTSPSTPLFSSISSAGDMSIALSCFTYLQSVFREVDECRPFELLRSYKDRSSYLLTHHARIIAMTCTHAAIKRHDFIAARLHYDTLVMEESAQVLEIETFIPLMLQLNDQESGSRLKRVVLLGDHQQLPPVIKNRTFASYSHLDQSLFSRLIRLGLPHVALDAQGRMRPSLAALWNWRYESLQDLPVVRESAVYQQANVGLLHEYQLIDVLDYQGVGESTPQPFYFQNLGEAEYVVAVYMHMRLIGYPASRIVILTSYNGQKHLIRDVLNQRCAANPLFGTCKVSTVDKYQGQQADYVLLSLVRTKHAGHMRDVRRLVVAMSRARLGLYVFCRAELFGNCFELGRCFRLLLSRPTQLQLVTTERCAFDQPLRTARRVEQVEQVAGVEVVRDVLDMGERVIRLTRQIQSEYGEYRRRVEAYEREKAEAQRRKREEEEARREAFEQLRSDELMAQRMEERNAEHQKETERLERELAVQQDSDLRKDGTQQSSLESVREVEEGQSDDDAL